jgi:mannan endo-1,4-beta-mannosidase
MGFFKRHKRAVLITLAACVVIGAGSLYWLRTSKSEFAQSFRQYVKNYIYPSAFPNRPNLKRGLNITGETVYVDGSIGAMPDKISGHDVKVMYETPEGSVFGDYATGFSVSLPAGMAPDLTMSPKLVSFESPGAKLVVTKEWTYDSDVTRYTDYYFYRFLLDENYRTANNIELLENTKTDKYERITVRLNGFSGKFDTYTYLLLKTGTQNFFFAMLKYSSGDQSAASLPQRVLDSFKYFKPEGTPVYTTDYAPELPDDWTADTRALYDKIANSDKVLWGIFTKNVDTEGIGTTIPGIEQKLDFKFPIILDYAALDSGFPSDFMERCSQEGRIVELTLQTTENNNSDLFAKSPWLELYKTGDDARIRAFAKAAKEFGKPFLFRLNNEMNSDWVSYGGVANLLDPDIFIDNWRTVYRIFSEEGVTNAIWIFNPNDRDAPPNAWNCEAAYYPGNGYAQIFGVTGYNNGTYYNAVTGEYWREFSDIYDRIENVSSGNFGSFPWMITEFASSSIGGDKVKWIDGMFRSLPKYANIKAAVWFSFADYDGKTPARTYWLDENDETLAAFKRGLESSGQLPPPG